ncbi:MAG: hypothetical protein Kow0031_13220 [Anaerolineae bacterium]
MPAYTVYVFPPAWQEIKHLPGNVRQRLKRTIDRLADNPYPPKSKKLNWDHVELNLCRLRLDRWRIVYAVNESEWTVDILTVRKRPPYDYTDLAQLIEALG